MKFKPMLVSAALLATVPAATFAQETPRPHSPGIGHTFFMRGSVVHADGTQVIVCIGRADGAQPGQELVVLRVTEHPHGPKGPPTFQRNRVGSVRIDAIIDDHFARATIVSGAIRKNDLVELQRS
ncbi:hypothetical protein ACFQ1E_13940 [Sphingomonas canadensis]|uniref:Uncharacterized protein n=1 Tax=Sphingomonas canadensis TaxID=1219257 RepID=A0ABW3H9G0_9SPHN|nr:hypothetical protein [Sphingomonas canadensis]MCW3837315.1 hypothetical protein [Sphingomonas canadensis]